MDDYFEQLMNAYLGGGWNIGDTTLDKAVTAAEGYLRGKIIKSMIEGAADGVVTVATSGASVVIGIIDSFMEYQKKLRLAGELSAGESAAYAMTMLGAKVDYSIVNGVIVIHGIQWDTTEGMLRTQGFLGTNKDKYPISEEALRQILGNGEMGENSVWKPLPPEQAGGLSAEEQQQLYNDYKNYRDYVDNSRANYEGALEDFYKAPNTDDPTKTNQEVLQEKYGDEYDELSVDKPQTLPPEVFQEFLEMYEEDKQ